MQLSTQHNTCHAPDWRLWTNSRIQEKEPERIEIEREGEKGRHRDRERKRETQNLSPLVEQPRSTWGMFKIESYQPPQNSAGCVLGARELQEMRPGPSMPEASFLMERKMIDVNHLQTQLTIEWRKRQRRGPEVQGVQGWAVYYDKDDLVFPFNISATAAKLKLQSVSDSVWPVIINW